MATDYTSNSKKSKEPGDATPPKSIEKVITTTVIVPKKPIWQKFRGLFAEADVKTVARFVVADVLLPAARAMLYDAVAMGSKRMIYGEQEARRHQFLSRTTYNSPVNRSYGGSPLSGTPQRFAPAPRPEPRVATFNRDEFLLSNQADAELVLERMSDIIESYDVVSVADLHDLVGLPSSHTDNKWGWTNLSTVQIRQVREGYLIDFPPAEAIQ